MKEHIEYIKTSTRAIFKAEKIFGSERALATALGVNRQNITYWKFNALLPYDKAMAIYVATDGRVDINELRSDCKDLTKRAELLILKKHRKKIVDKN